MQIHGNTPEGATTGGLQLWLSTLPQNSAKLAVCLLLAIPAVLLSLVIIAAQAWAPACQPHIQQATANGQAVPMLVPAACQVQVEYAIAVFGFIAALGSLAYYGRKSDRTTDIDFVKANPGPAPQINVEKVEDGAKVSQTVTMPTRPGAPASPAVSTAGAGTALSPHADESGDPRQPNIYADDERGD